MPERLAEATILENGLPDVGIFIVDDPRKAFALVDELEKRMKANSRVFAEDSNTFLASMDDFGRIELQIPECSNLYVLARIIETKAREFTSLGIFAEMQRGKQSDILTPKMGGRLRL